MNLLGNLLTIELMRPNSLDISHGDKCLKNMNLMSKIVFEVLERTNWNNDSYTLREFDETWFTDGSKNDSGTHAEFVNFKVSKKNNRIRSIALGSYPKFFQATVIAIERCARKIKWYKRKNDWYRGTAIDPS